MKITLAFVRLALLVFAPLILLLWGISYLAECLLIVSAPGAPVVFDYKTPAGTYRLTAEAYAIDFGKGQAWVLRPRLIDERKSPIALAERIEADGVMAALSGSGPLAFRVSRLEAWVVRGKTGHINLIDSIPERKGPPSDTPFHAEVVNSRLHWRDDLANGFRQEAAVPRLVVDGRKGDWLASTASNLPTMGSCDLTVWSMRGNVVVRGSLAAPDGRRLLAYARTAPETKNQYLDRFNAENLSLRGVVAAQITSAPQAFGTVEANLANVTDGGRRFLDKADYTGAIRGRAVTGNLNARGSMNGRLDIAANWITSPRFAVRGQLDGGKKESLIKELRQIVPNDIRFSRVAFVGGANFDSKRWQVAGRIKASDVARGKQTFGETEGQLAVDKTGVSATAVAVSGPLGRFTGAVSEKGGGLVGYAKGNGFKLPTELPKTVSLKNEALSGIAVLSGTTKQPVVAFDATGAGMVASKRLSGKADVRGRGILRGDQLSITFAEGSIDGATAVATGSLNLTSQNLEGYAQATGINAHKLDDGLMGGLSLQGRIAGTIKEPRWIGNAEMVDGKIGSVELPLMVAALSATRSGVESSRVEAVAGLALLHGAGGLQFKDSRLHGLFEAKGIDLGELLGQDNVAGVGNLTNGILSGTLDRPRVQADVEASHVAYKDTVVDDVSGHLDLQNHIAAFTGIRALVGMGTLEGTASYGTQSGSATAAMTANKVPVSQLIPELRAEGIEGLFSGKIGLEYRDKAVAGLTADLSLDGFKAEGVSLGNGFASLAQHGNLVTGDVEIGQLDQDARFIQANDLKYDLKSGQFVGKLFARNIQLNELTSYAASKVQGLTFDKRDLLASVAGNLIASASIQGNSQAQDFSLDHLEVQGLKVKDQDFGSLEAKLARHDKVWDVKEAKLTLGKSTAVAKGSVQEGGPMNLEGSITDFEPAKLAVFDDRLAQVNGTSTVDFAAGGTTSEPDIRASAKTDRLSITGAEDFSMLLDSIRIRRSHIGAGGKLEGGIEASGKLVYQGIQGDIEAQAPFDLPLRIPEDQPVVASLKIDQDPESLLAHFPQLKANVSGRITGDVEITGHINDLSAHGIIDANLKQLALSGWNTKLQDFNTRLSFKDDLLELTSDAKGSLGGSLSANATVRLSDFQSLVNQIGEGTAGDLWGRPVVGFMKAQNFLFDEKKDSAYNGLLNADLAMSGRLRNPAITGSASVKSLQAVLGSSTTQSAEQPQYAIDPTFNVQLAVDPKSRISTTLAQLDVEGSGILRGSLSQPDLRFNMDVTGGTLTLPAAKVRIERPSSIAATYTVDRAGIPDARLDLSLEGRTAITAPRFGDELQLERYSINLKVTGDLLGDKPLDLVATSDPGDLSQDRILALLGRTDILNAVGSDKSEAQRLIRDALTSYALPAFFDPLLGHFAQGLNLDYFNLEYNTFEQASVSTAKSLSPTLFLTYRRQISQPLFGEKQRYDFRLVYRLPFSKNHLDRFRLSIGQDQDKPWKIAVEWSTRH
ncbi:MAG: translocation/assembly module TamB domain-containing protein [Armatimonadetes bacterium]|nr:translocation/assembly module TamB domain-containing protein [Armatimonadota bacterium]